MTEKKEKTLGQRIVRAGVAVGVAHLLFKLAGLIQAVVMGRCLSPEAYEAVNAFAFESCIFSLFLINQELIGPTFLPVFMRECDERGDGAGWRFANTVFALQILILVPVVCVLIVSPEWAVRLWSKWTPERNPEQFRMGRDAVRILAPALFGLALGTTTYALLNGYKRFFLAAFGDSIWKFAAVAGVLGGVIGFGRGHAAGGLLLGLLLGSALKVVTHLAGLRDRLGLLRPRLHLRDPAVRTMLWLALPLVLGVVFAKVRDAFNNVYILSHLESAGLIQANSIGRKLLTTLNYLIPYTLGIAMFPFFCELVDRNDRERLALLITQAGRMLLAVFIPFCVVVAVVAPSLIAVVFKGGEFQDEAVRRTALSTACYTFVLPAAAVESLAMQAFFANRRMISVTVIGLLFSGFSMAVSWAGLRLWEGNDMRVLGVIAAGFAVARLLKSATLIVLLRKSAPVFPLLPTLAFLARVGLASAVAGAGAWLAMRGSAGVLPAVLQEGRLGDLGRLAAGGVGGLAAAAAGAWFCAVREPFEMTRWALDQARGRLKRRVAVGGGDAG